MPQTVGVPVKLLHEAEGFKVTIELTNGETYRGTLVDAEDNMNCQIANVQLTGRDGRVSKLEHCYLRGSKIRFMVLPDMLKNAPMFKRFDPKNKIRGLGRGIGAAGPSALPGARSRGRGRSGPSRPGPGGTRGSAGAGEP